MTIAIAKNRIEEYLCEPPLHSLKGGIFALRYPSFSYRATFLDWYERCLKERKCKEERIPRRLYAVVGSGDDFLSDNEQTRKIFKSIIDLIDVKTDNPLEFIVLFDKSIAENEQEIKEFTRKLNDYGTFVPLYCRSRHFKNHYSFCGMGSFFELPHRTDTPLTARHGVVFLNNVEQNNDDREIWNETLREKDVVVLD